MEYRHMRGPATIDREFTSSITGGVFYCLVIRNNATVLVVAAYVKTEAKAHGTKRGMHFDMHLVLFGFALGRQLSADAQDLGLPDSFSPGSQVVSIKPSCRRRIPVTPWSCRLSRRSSRSP